MISSAGFGWEITNFHGNGADIYFRVENAMTLNSVNIDVAFSPTSTSTTGFAEVLCGAAVSRGGPPTFDNTQGHAFFDGVASSNFGAEADVLGSSSLLIVGLPATPGQDGFYRVILKTFVPSNGTAAVTHRQVLANSSLTLNAGDFLVFHMDHAGVPGDAEMQVVLNYSLA